MHYSLDDVFVIYCIQKNRNMNFANNYLPANKFTL